MQISQLSILMKLSPSRPQTKKMTSEQALKSQSNYNGFADVLSRIGCFDGTSSLQVKPNSKPYQVPLRCVAYLLQKPCKEEFE